MSPKAAIFIMALILFICLGAMFASVVETKDEVVAAEGCIPTVALSTSSLNRRDMAFLIALRKNGTAKPDEESIRWAWKRADEYVEVFHQLRCK